MTLEQTFPGLRNKPGSAIVALADNVLDLYGPAEAAVSELANNTTKQLIAQIKSIDPNWHYDRLGPITTAQGHINEVNDLRFQRAAALLRVKGDAAPLQVETLRFMQQRADEAYTRGKALLKAGKLDVRLSEQEALGNYIDREVRQELRERYNRLGIDSARKGPVRVNRRENVSAGSELTYRFPDNRVDNVAFDISLTRKTLATPQVRDFFRADFQPDLVVIIRPSQLGIGHTYAIPRPETKSMPQDGYNPYYNPNSYIPASLSEINDLLGSMILWAPTFIDETGVFPDRNIDTRFYQLNEGFGRLRHKLSEERYVLLLDLAARAKALFAADQDDANGKADEGRKLLFEMEDVLNEVRRRRVRDRLPDDEGEITGD
jgi:hypothetical protein